METDKLITGIVTLLTAIIGVSIIAVLVSQKSATPQVLQAGGSAFSSILSTALSPVSGASSGVPNLGGSSIGSLFSNLF